MTTIHHLVQRPFFNGAPISGESSNTGLMLNGTRDGKQVASTSPYTGIHSGSTGAFAIGESDVFTGRFFDGSIDEVTLWNRALSATEVTAIFNAAGAH